MLDIGEGAVFGYGVRISGHIVKPTADGQDLLCVVRAVRVGAGAFVGAGVVLGPGAQIEEGAVVDAGTSVVGTRHRKKAP
jgi:acetyltransferase-like isoleucine patch superfamily enzyme